MFMGHAGKVNPRDRKSARHPGEKEDNNPMSLNCSCSQNPTKSQELRASWTSQIRVPWKDPGFPTSAGTMWVRVISREHTGPGDAGPTGAGQLSCHPSLNYEPLCGNGPVRAQGCGKGPQTAPQAKQQGWGAIFWQALGTHVTQRCTCPHSSPGPRGQHASTFTP